VPSAPLPPHEKQHPLKMMCFFSSSHFWKVGTTRYHVFPLLAPINQNCRTDFPMIRLLFRASIPNFLSELSISESFTHSPIKRRNDAKGRSCGVLSRCYVVHNYIYLLLLRSLTEKSSRGRQMFAWGHRSQNWQWYVRIVRNL
jgi:hypothetical protein